MKKRIPMYLMGALISGNLLAADLDDVGFTDYGDESSIEVLADSVERDLPDTIEGNIRSRLLEAEKEGTYLIDVDKLGDSDADKLLRIVAGNLEFAPDMHDYEVEACVDILENSGLDLIDNLESRFGYEMTDLFDLRFLAIPEVQDLVKSDSLDKTFDYLTDDLGFSVPHVGTLIRSLVSDFGTGTFETGRSDHALDLLQRLQEQGALDRADSVAMPFSLMYSLSQAITAYQRGVQELETKSVAEREQGKRDLASLVVKENRVFVEQLEQERRYQIPSNAARLETYASFAQSLPETTFHEGLHALAIYAVGANLNEFDILPQHAGNSRYNLGQVRTDDDLSDFQTALVSIAPYIGESLIKHYAFGEIFEHNDMGDGIARQLIGGQMVFSLILDSYGGRILTNSQDGSDLHRFSEATGIPRIPVSLAVQALYTYTALNALSKLDSRDSASYAVAIPLVLPLAASIVGSAIDLFD